MTRKLECKASVRLLKDAFASRGAALTHTEALDLVARLEGYEAWSHMKSAKRHAATPSAPKGLTFQEYLLEKHGAWYNVPTYPREDWSHAVSSNDTTRGYFDWVLHEHLVHEVNELDGVRFVEPGPVYCLDVHGVKRPWNIETDLTDCTGEINSSQLENKPSLLQLLLDVTVHERMRALLVGEETFVAALNGALGVLFEGEYYSRESDDADGSRGYSPYTVVQDKLRQRLETLQKEFPEAMFGLPPADKVYHGRPAIWAFVSEDVARQMGEERRKALSYRIGSM